MSIDKVKLREVTIFADNDYKLYEVLTTTYLDNLKRRDSRGNMTNKSHISSWNTIIQITLDLV